MKELIQDFAQQLQASAGLGSSLQLAQPRLPFTSVSLIGLGGSAFGGEIVRNYTFGTGKVPFLIHRGYQAPAYLDAHALVIASSYSGNTEETLLTAEAARLKGAPIVAITSGGQLASWAKQHQLPLILLPTGYPPRAAAGYSLVQQLYVLQAYGLIPPVEEDLAEAIEVVQAFQDHEQAQALARQLQDKVTIIYASDAVDSIAIRLRQQINENAKQLCWHHVVPEMNHNELVGWQNPAFLLEKAVVILLRSSYEHPRVSLRFDINRAILAQHASTIVQVQAKGKGKLAQLLYLLHFADWVSLYLAEANGVEPGPVAVIDYLKNELAVR